MCSIRTALTTVVAMLGVAAVVAAVATAASPRNILAPRITGPAIVGKTLLATQGTWDQHGVGLSMQWQRCDTGGHRCTDISGAHGLAWTSLQADLGHRLRMIVTAGAKTAVASAVTSVIAKSTAPDIAPSDPFVLAAGDIACAPDADTVKRTSCHERRTSNLLTRNASAILILGDAQYECGAADAWSSFDATWGRFKALMRPVIGNHEYQTTGGANCPGDGSGYFDYFGSAAGPPGMGYYSFDLGDWHLIALNSECEHVACATGSPQERWLRADLAAARKSCVLAFWHEPRFVSTVVEPDPRFAAFWRDLYRAHTDLVLNGHIHEYARFAPSDPSGRLMPNGIRQFIVGTGGRDFYPETYVRPNSLVEDFQNTTFGVLRLNLGHTGYGWRFVPEAGGKYTDNGFGSCHPKK
jgi:hypothetical protein